MLPQRFLAEKSGCTTRCAAWTSFLLLFCLLLLSSAAFVRDPFNGALRHGVHLLGKSTSDVPECRPASVTVSVATTILNAFAQVVLIPAVQAESNVAVIPEQEDDHVWVDSILLHHFRVNTLSVKTAMPDEHSVTVNAKGFGLEVNETRFRYTYLGIRCYGHFTATLNETDIDAAVGFTLLPTSRWNATFAHLNFAWGTLDIQHALDSKACGMAQSIVELFTGQLDRYIAEKVKKKLDEDGKNKATETMNSLFADVGVFALTPPIMTEDRLTVVLDGTPEVLGCAPLPPATSVPQLLPRDIAAHTTVHDINNVLYNAATHNVFVWEDYLPPTMNTSLFSDVLPEVYAMCPECPMYTVVNTTTPPVVVFLPNNTVTVTIRDLAVGLVAVPRTEEERSAVHTLVFHYNRKNHAKFAPVYAELGFSTTSHVDDLRDFPVLVLSCSATMGVKEVVVLENGRSVHYELLDVPDFSVDVAASLIGDVDAKEIEQKGMEAWNGFAVPLANTHSPYKLPFFLRKALLNMSLVNAGAGANIGFMKDAISAMSRLNGW